MYDQLPMQVSLMERKREREALLRESELLRVLGRGPALSTRMKGWLVPGRKRLISMARPRPSQASADPLRSELGSSAAA
jgi:hypothetical protein